MAAAILTQGLTAIRDQLKTLVSHICVSDDSSAFAVGQVGINPNATGTSAHIGASTEADQGAATFDASITIDGTTQFTGKSIFAIGLAKGLGVRSATGSGGTHTGGAIVGTDCLSRSVRSLGIGVQAGDTFTIAVRVTVVDNS